MTGGPPPTAWKARPGGERRPGMRPRARSNSSRERSRSVTAGHQDGDELAERAQAEVGGGNAPGTAEAKAVDPGDFPAGLLGAEDVGHGVIAGVEDLVRRQAQAAGEEEEYLRVGLYGPGLLGGDHGIELEAVAGEAGGEEVIVCVGEEREAVVGAKGFA